MLAMFISPNGGYCAVLSTKREGFTSVITEGWCGTRISSGAGVFQMPVAALTCPSCKAAIAQAEAAYAQIEAAKAPPPPAPSSTETP